MQVGLDLERVEPLGLLIGLEDYQLLAAVWLAAEQDLAAAVEHALANFPGLFPCGAKLTGLLVRGSQDAGQRLLINAVHNKAKQMRVLCSNFLVCSTQG